MQESKFDELHELQQIGHHEWYFYEQPSSTLDNFVTSEKKILE
jgi:hypothetical protein